MKKIFIVLISLIISTAAFGQITITKEQLQSLPENVVTVLEITAKADSIANNAVKNASWGKEIGYAVDSALDAVEEHVINLAETPLGHTVTFLVCWRFLYKDIVGLFIGLIFICLLVWAVKKLLTIEGRLKDIDEDAQVAVIVCGWIGAAIFFIAAVCCIF